MKKLITLKLAVISAATLLLSSCTSTGLFLWNTSLKLKADHSLMSDIRYGEHAWQKLDLHVPESESSELRPVFVFFYGGSWDSGTKEMYFFLADVFTRLGYIVVIPDYLKYPEARFPTFIEDGAAAIAWTKANIRDYGGDPSKIVISGHSAGAHLGGLLLSDERYLATYQLKPLDIKGFVGLAGPYNFSPTRPRLKEIFGPEENYPNMWANSFVNGNEPPMLLLHGAQDTTVGVQNQQALIDKLAEVGNSSKGILYDELTHTGILLSLTPLFKKQSSTLEDTQRFFKSVLEL